MSDTIIIACGGIIPSARCDAKVHRAVKLGKNKLPIIFTGKQTRRKGEKQETEAAYMKRLAIQLGYPRSQVFTEEQAQETRGNAYYSKKLIEKKFGITYKHIIVITAKYHMPKTKLIFKKVFWALFTLSFSLTPNHFSPEEEQTRLGREKLSIQANKRRSKDIKTGGDTSIRKFLRKFPVYNPKAPYTLQEVHSRFQTGNFPDKL